VCCSVDQSRGPAAECVQDYGPDDMFAHMQGECVEMTIDKYTYKVCPFGQATQVEGGSATSLGTFSTFAEEHTIMEFTNVRPCLLLRRVRDMAAEKSACAPLGQSPHVSHSAHCLRYV
jgi:hypothetical protein